MIIGIDASRAESAHKTGVERYTFEIIRAMRAQQPADTRVVLYSRTPLPFALGPWSDRWENKVLHWPPKYLWTQLRLSYEIWRNPPDVLFVPGHVLPHVIPKRTVNTIHDATFIAHPELYPFVQRMILNSALMDACRRASVIIVPSEYTATQIAALRPDRGVVIPHGVSPHPTSPKLGEGISNPSPLGRETGRAQYFLVVGRIEKKKNLEVLIDAFSRLSAKGGSASGGKTETFRLIFAGSFGFGARAIVEHARLTMLKILKSNFSAEVRLQQKIEFLGAVSDDELFTLMKNAAALLHPCPVEGFGLPVIEAMSVGVPVVCADAGGAAEAAGDAAITIDATSVDAWVHAIEQVTFDAFRNPLIERGKVRAATFTWGAAAAITWQAMVGR
jgi:glycosyltransferase involved in cell wall biosynthesis